MYIKSLYPDPAPLVDTNFHHILFNNSTLAWPDFVLHIDAVHGAQRTFKQFLELMRAGATALGGPVDRGCLGLNGEGNQMVAIISENHMDYILLVHSLMMTTTPFAPVASYSTPFELKHALTLSKATHIFVQEKFMPSVLEVAKEVGIPNNHVFLIGGSSASGRSDDHRRRKDLSDLITHVQSNRVSPLSTRPAKRNTLAYLIFSSGTTGPPKGAMVSHGNMQAAFNVIYAMAEAAAAIAPSSLPPERQITLACLPFHHTYGMQSFCFRAFSTPSTLVIMPKWNISKALVLISRYRISHLPLVPSLINQLVNSPEASQTDTSSISVIYSGAAYLSPEVLDRIPTLFGKNASIFEAYGMSEGTYAPIAHPIPGLLKHGLPKGSVGVLLPGTEALILREDGTHADPDEPGDLYLRNASTVMGYYGNEEATKETFLADGWLRTGDKFRVNENGCFFFADRAKDTLKISGIQVSPSEIEDVLLAHPDKLISDVAVAGVPGGRSKDERLPRAWVVLSNEVKFRIRKGQVDDGWAIGALETWHKKNLSKHKWLRGGIEVVDQIPRSPTGKVLRRVLQERYSSGVGNATRGRLRGKL